MIEGRGWAKHESPLLLMHIIQLHNCYPFKVLQSFFCPDTIKTLSWPNFSHPKLGFRQHKITIDRDRTIKGNGSLHPRTDAPTPILSFTLAVITSTRLFPHWAPDTSLIPGLTRGFSHENNCQERSMTLRRLRLQLSNTRPAAAMAT